MIRVYEHNEEEVHKEYKYKLLLKCHYNTGVNYLCVTKQKNFVKYKGSGVAWKRLLKKHPESEILTYILAVSNDLEAFNQACKEYSQEFDIFNNRAFANLIEEEGYPTRSTNLEKWDQLATPEQKAKRLDKANKSREETWQLHPELRNMELPRAALSEFLAKHNVTNAMQIPEVAQKNKESREATMLERYGVKNNMLIPEVSNKAKTSREETMMRKYGVKHASQIPGKSEQIKASREKTMLERYGVVNISQSPTHKKKISEGIKRAKSKNKQLDDNVVE